MNPDLCLEQFVQVAVWWGFRRETETHSILGDFSVQNIILWS